MSAAALLARLDALGVSATAVGEALRLRPASAIPADLLAALRANKVALLALLVAPANDVGTLPARAMVPVDAGGLLRYLRETLRCRVTLEDGEVRIGPDHRCPPAALAAAMAVSGELAAYLVTELRHTPSWWRNDPHEPPRGAWCGCCRLRRWWTRDHQGWCCFTCHPPLGLAADAFEETWT